MNTDNKLLSNLFVVLQVMFNVIQHNDFLFPQALADATRTLPTLAHHLFRLQHVLPLVNIQDPYDRNHVPSGVSWCNVIRSTGPWPGSSYLTAVCKNAVTAFLKLQAATSVMCTLCCYVYLERDSVMIARNNCLCVMLLSLDNTLLTVE
jgi:hypothetical protein